MQNFGLFLFFVSLSYSRHAISIREVGIAVSWARLKIADHFKRNWISKTAGQNNFWGAGYCKTDFRSRNFFTHRRLYVLIGYLVIIRYVNPLFCSLYVYKKKETSLKVGCI